MRELSELEDLEEQPGPPSDHAASWPMLPSERSPSVEAGTLKSSGYENFPNPDLPQRWPWPPPHQVEQPSKSPTSSGVWPLVERTALSALDLPLSLHLVELLVWSWPSWDPRYGSLWATLQGPMHERLWHRSCCWHLWIETRCDLHHCRPRRQKPLSTPGAPTSSGQSPQRPQFHLARQCMSFLRTGTTARRPSSLGTSPLPRRAWVCPHSPSWSRPRQRTAAALWDLCQSGILEKSSETRAHCHCRPSRRYRMQMYPSTWAMKMAGMLDEIVHEQLVHPTLHRGPLCHSRLRSPRPPSHRRACSWRTGSSGNPNWAASPDPFPTAHWWSWHCSWWSLRPANSEKG